MITILNISSIMQQVLFCFNVVSHENCYFLNKIGLMEGEVLSPILFNLYVNDFELEFFKFGMYAL